MKFANQLHQQMLAKICTFGGAWLLSLFLLAHSSAVMAQDGAPIESITPVVQKRGVMQQMHDVSTTFQVNNMIKSAPAVNKKAEINVTTVNDIVLLTGSVKSAEDKRWAEETAQRHPRVLKVINQLSVRSHRTFGEILGDKRLQISVKARLTKALKDKSSTVHTVVYKKVVYLMGVVTRATAETAAEVASNTRKVERVITIFQIHEGDGAGAPTNAAS